MWICPKCNERIEDQFDTCWKCAQPGDGTKPPPSAPEPPPASTPAASEGCGAAFVKGGLGCLGLFLGLAFLAVLVGGRAHADPLGLVFLFLIGGVIGLVIFAIYNKGRKDAAANDPLRKD